jgi:hypothetical protein
VRYGSSGLPKSDVCSIIDDAELVNGGAYMDFREATDGLFARVDHEDLAKALGVSIATIRQARLRPSASAHRAPPPEWHHAVIRMAEERVWHYRRLVESLRKCTRDRSAQ